LPDAINTKIAGRQLSLSLIYLDQLIAMAIQLYVDKALRSTLTNAASISPNQCSMQFISNMQQMHNAKCLVKLQDANVVTSVSSTYSFQTCSLLYVL